MSDAVKSNVVPFVVAQSEYEIAIRERINTVPQARGLLLKMEAACTLGLTTLDFATKYGDAEALRGVAHIFKYLTDVFAA